MCGEAGEEESWVWSVRAGYGLPLEETHRICVLYWGLRAVLLVSEVVVSVFSVRAWSVEAGHTLLYRTASPGRGETGTLYRRDGNSLEERRDGTSL